jgi:hypothetical protein
LIDLGCTGPLEFETRSQRGGAGLDARERISTHDTAGLYDGFEMYGFPTDAELEDAVRGGAVT